MAIIKSNDCGGLSVGGGTTVNVSQSNCNCGCGGGTGGTGGSGTGGVLPPELGGPPVPTGHSGGGTGGSPGDGPGGSGGSGGGGSINPDGGDTQIVPAACIPLGTPPNQPFGSAGFELASLDISSLVQTAIESIPGWESGDQAVSASISVEGLAWTGFSIIGGPLTPTRKLTVVDTANATRQVAFTEERGGISVQGVGVSSLSYRYKDQFNIDLTGPNPVKVDGQMPRSPIAIDGPGGADKDSPAWLTMSLCSAVKRKPLGAVFDFNRWRALADGTDGIWDKNHFATFIHDAAQEGWSPIHFNSTGNSDYPNFVVPYNDSSNYGHFWPIVKGKLPVAPGKTHLHIGGKYGTGAGGGTISFRVTQQATPSGPYNVFSTQGDFVWSAGANLDFGVDLDLTFPTPGTGLWNVEFEISDWQFAMWDLVGAFS